MGDSRKYPYPTTGGMSILTPPCPRKFQNAYPPLALRIPKSLTPASPPEFSTFVSDPLEFLFVCLNLQTNEKLALFPSAKELAIKEGGRPRRLLPHAKMLLIPIKLFLSANLWLSLSPQNVAILTYLSCLIISNNHEN